MKIANLLRWWNSGWFLLCLVIALLVHFKRTLEYFQNDCLNKKLHAAYHGWLTFSMLLPLCVALNYLPPRSFTISLESPPPPLSWPLEPSFLLSSCTRYWALRRPIFSGSFQFLSSSSFSRLKRFSFTFKRIHQGWDAASQVERDMQNLRNTFEVQNTTTLKHAGPEPRCLWEKEGKFICLLGHGQYKASNEVRKDNPRQLGIICTMKVEIKWVACQVLDSCLVESFPICKIFQGVHYWYLLRPLSVR